MLSNALTHRTAVTTVKNTNLKYTLHLYSSNCLCFERLHSQYPLTLEAEIGAPKSSHNSYLLFHYISSDFMQTESNNLFVHGCFERKAALTKLKLRGFQLVFTRSLQDMLEMVLRLKEK